MPPAVLFFCGAPLVDRPISQRVARFGAHLAAEGVEVRLTAVDPAFEGTPFVRADPVSGAEVEVVGPTHYRVGSDGSQQAMSPASYLRECRKIAHRLRDRLEEMGADTIVLSTTLPASLYALAALRRSPASVWLDADDWSAAQLTAGGGGHLAGIVYGGIERLVPRLADGITVCSSELARLLPGATVVPNFVRLAEVTDREELDPSPGSKVRVVFASSVTAYHGHLGLLEALARRRDDCDGLELWVVGDGLALDACRRLVGEAGLDGLVRFTGWLDRPAMLRVLARSEVSVLPLRDTRLDRARFPLKMLDALASGCALAASDAGMAHEILTHRGSALLSPPGDMDALVANVLELAADAALRARLAAAGRAVVRDYDEPLVCGRWMDLLSGRRR